MATMHDPQPCPFAVGDVVRAKGQKVPMTVIDVGATWTDRRQHHLVALWVDGLGEKWLPWAALEYAIEVDA